MFVYNSFNCELQRVPKSFLCALTSVNDFLFIGKIITAIAHSQLTD